MTDQLTNCIMLSALATEEVIRIDKEGFHYKGEFIADAGEAHRLMVEFLNQPTPKPEPVAPTDEDLEDLAEVMNVSGNPVPAMRRALELWGNSQKILASSPQPEPGAPTDEEIAQFVTEWWENMQGFAPHGDKTVYTVFEFVAREHFADFTRDVFARWGTPNNTSEEN